MPANFLRRQGLEPASQSLFESLALTLPTRTEKQVCAWRSAASESAKSSVAHRDAHAARIAVGAGATGRGKKLSTGGAASMMPMYVTGVSPALYESGQADQSHASWMYGKGAPSGGFYGEYGDMGFGQFGRDQPAGVHLGAPPAGHAEGWERECWHLKACVAKDLKNRSVSTMSTAHSSASTEDCDSWAAGVPGQ